jgi:predicted SnoaL-like aldol condensation-catalyzing enzyme
VHENVGVVVEGDLVALRTIITGTHTGDYAAVAPTGSAIQTSASHIFRVRDDQVVEHWPVLDTYRMMPAIGAIPGVASVFQEQILRVPPSPGGLFPERLGTEFGRAVVRPITREESRAVVARLYDGVISTGRGEDVDMLAEDYIQNSGWTPDGRAAFASALVTSRGASPTGAPCRHGWSSKTTGSPHEACGTAPSPKAAERRTSRHSISSASRRDLLPSTEKPPTGISAYQSFGLLSEEVKDVSLRTRQHPKVDDRNHRCGQHRQRGGEPPRTR